MTEAARNGLLVAATVVIAAVAFYFLFVGVPLTSEAGQNLLWPSDNFAGANWTSQHVTVMAGAGPAPDGKGSATRLAATSDNGRHYIYYSQSATPVAATYIFSIYAKPAELSALWFEIRDDPLPGKYGTADCNLANGGSAAKAGDIVDAGVEQAANGWLRCWAAMPFDRVNIDLGINIVSASGDYEYRGDGHAGMLVWGAQFEPGKRPTGYVPTTTGPVMK